MSGEWLRKPAGSTTVVFVHGILSSGDTCWKNNNGTYWPTLIEKDAMLKGTGIYIFSYETSIFSGTYSLNDVVDALKEYLKLDKVIDSRNIIFVCHSMGGIVVRKYLVERRMDLIERNTFIGLFLLASPSLGAKYANFLKPLARLIGHTQADALRFEQDNIWLNGLDKEFINVKEAGRLQIEGKELVEDKSIVLRSIIRNQVVEPFSAAKYFGEPFKVPKSDHFSIAKPNSPTAIQHRLLCEFIKASARSAKAVETKDETLSVETIEAPLDSIQPEASTVKSTPGTESSMPELSFEEAAAKFRQEQQAKREKWGGGI